MRIPLPREIPGGINPLQFVFESWRRYLEGPKVVRRPREQATPRGARVRRPFVPAPLPPLVLPGPGTLPVEIPTAQPGPGRGVFGAPVGNPSYDPFVVAPPTPSVPARMPVAAPAARSMFRLAPLAPGVRSPSRAPQRDPKRATRPRGDAPPIGDPLTGFKPRQQLGLGKITRTEASNDPCAVKVRDMKRRQRKRRQECKRFVDKTIRVCADK
jgi:hypothetical protein